MVIVGGTIVRNAGRALSKVTTCWFAFQGGFNLIYVGINNSEGMVQLP